MTVHMPIVPASRVRPHLRMREIAGSLALPEGASSAISGPEIPGQLGPQIALVLLREVAEKYRVDWRDIIGPSRRRPPTWARQELMYLLRCRYWSLPQIGRFVRRDHTTALHGIRRHAKRNGLRPA